jgi:hypothetical protein
MSARNEARLLADMEGEFLVFVVELRIHQWWRFGKWYPTVIAMGRMLTELMKNPEFGLLHFEYWFAFRRQLFLMYWRSYEHMHDWVLNKDATHIAGWKQLNQLMKDHPNVLGFWHESYVVQPDQYEAFYRNVPTVGLGKVGKLTPLTGRATTAAARLRETRTKTASAG